MQDVLWLATATEHVSYIFFMDYNWACSASFTSVGYPYRENSKQYHAMHHLRLVLNEITFPLSHVGVRQLVYQPLRTTLVPTMHLWWAARTFLLGSCWWWSFPHVFSTLFPWPQNSHLWSSAAGWMDTAHTWMEEQLSVCVCVRERERDRERDSRYTVVLKLVKAGMKKQKTCSAKCQSDVSNKNKTIFQTLQPLSTP